MSTGKTQSFEDSFSGRFREARLRKGLTQEELATQLGVSNGSVGNWEIEPSIPRAEVMAKISSLLEVETEFLISGKTSSRKNLALADAPANYKVDDLLFEIEKLREQMTVVERAAKRLKPNSRPLSEAQQIAKRASDNYDKRSS